ncbi:MAG: hypothetical protein IPL43_11750 [Micropruina sp.]|nr:hypothetical protein [Micropruina sp.]
MQRSRRGNPYPFTWEIPVAVTVAVLFVLAVGVQLGRSVANTFAGNGWVFVDRPRLFSSLAGIVTGHADAGLAGVVHPATQGVLWACLVVVELIVVVGCVVAAKAGLDRWGPTRVRGMATRGEAEALLGRTRLRRHAKVIRPDLYGPSKGGLR